VKVFDAGKTRMIGLPYDEKNYDDMLSRFHLRRVFYFFAKRDIARNLR